MQDLTFTFSDLLTGYVTQFDAATDSFDVKTSDGRAFQVALTATTFAELVRNLGEPYHDATGQMREMLSPGRYVFAYGVFYPSDKGHKFEAKHLVFSGVTENDFRFEKQDWWIKQVRELADFYLKSQFGDGPIDYNNYRTSLLLAGSKGGSTRQETDTISRLVYGFASAYLMTGDDRYLEAATKGTDYLRQHFRFEDKSEGICYWYHAVDMKPDGSRQKIFASEFGDDYDAIPCYEQIYALAGPTQTYRVTGDPRIVSDIKGTVHLFHRYFKDKSAKGGFYSHLDPIRLSPHSQSLGRNRARKSWNSVGDHAPAYLINLWLATGEREYADFLEYTFDTIAKHFPDYDHSPFVNERFQDDWSHDLTWGWQQDRAVVGHNLKIAWNLMRMHSLSSKESYVNLARKIAGLMPQVGMDKQRGGWYDVVERVRKPGEADHRYVWHDRKAWWQQEQGILAYLILAGVLKDAEYQRWARESAAFYNAWFLDTDSGGIYFNVLANGLPYLLGTERGKGSHSMSGYHSFELAYLAAVYTNLLVTKQPMDLYFKPTPGGFPDNILRVQPDILPPGSVILGEVWINGTEYTDFDPEELTIRLPADRQELRVRVRLIPTGISFSADTVESANGTAKIVLSGTLDAAGLKSLEEQVNDAREEGARNFVLDAGKLTSISAEAVRYLSVLKQKLGAKATLAITSARGQVQEMLEESELDEECVVA